MCTNVPNLISATCTSTGMTITVDETCRAEFYPWIDFKDATFVDGDVNTVEMPASPGSTCVADGTGTDWKYQFLFTQCNFDAAMLNDTHPDTQGITWYTYSAYLNYDSPIATAQFVGIGNIKQLDQESVKNYKINGDFG